MYRPLPEKPISLAEDLRVRPIIEPRETIELTLHPGQKRLLEDRTHRRVACIAGVGWGKQLDVSTPIPTPDGFKLMGELVVGDKVLSDQGEPCNVTLATPVDFGAVCFELTFIDESRLIADLDHQWVTATGEDPVARVRTTREIFDSFHDGHYIDLSPGVMDLRQTSAPLCRLYSECFAAEAARPPDRYLGYVSAYRRERFFTSRLYLTAITPVGMRLARCITVDSPNSMYLAGETFIPTHNTKFGPKWHFKRCVENWKSAESLVIAPDNKLLRQRCLAEYEDFLTTIGLKEGRGRNCDFAIHRSAGDIFINFRWGPRGLNSWSQRVFFLTGESPSKIVSYNISHAWLDEPASMVQLVDSNVAMRLRCPNAVYRQRLYTGTPEGLNWFFRCFDPKHTPRIEGTPFSESDKNLVLHGRSSDNPYLDEQYLQMLDDEFKWDEQYYANYVLGEWVSMTRNGFYYKFNPSEHIGDFPPDPDTQTLYASFDNNVSQLTFVVLQPFRDKYLIVADNGGRAHNLDDASAMFVDMFPPEIWGQHEVVLLGDSTLWHQSIHSHISGFEKLAANLKPHYRRLTIRAPRANPTVEERSRCTNKLLAENRLLFHRGCTKTIESVRTAEADTNNKIKKPRGESWTHAMEAVDMAIAYLEPSRLHRSYRGLK